MKYRLAFFIFVMTLGGLRAVPSLINGSFENGFAPWQISRNEGLENPGRLVEGGAYEGNCYYEMGREDQRENYIYVSLPVEPGTSYTLDMALKAQEAQEGDLAVRLLCYRRDVNGNLVNNDFVWVPAHSGVNELIRFGGTSDWRTFSVYVDEECFQPDTVQVNLLFVRSNNGQGMIGIDDVSWTETPRKLGPRTWMGDGSFETTCWPFYAEEAERRAGAGFHGEYALVLQPGKGMGTHYIFDAMRPGQPGVFAFYARAEKPGRLLTDTTNEFYGSVGGTSFELTEEWQFCRVPVSPGGSSHLGLGFLNQTDGEVFIDCLSIYSGTLAPSAYAPQRLSFGVPEENVPGAAYFAGDEPMERVVMFRNNTTEKIAFDYTVQLESPGLEPQKLLQGTVTLEADSRCDIPFRVLEQQNPGYYVIRTIVKTEEETSMSARPFLVTPPPLPITDDSFMGFHTGGYETFRRIGMANVRHYRFGQYWPMENGDYVTDTSDKGSFDLRYPFSVLGMRHMDTLFTATLLERLHATREAIPFDELARFASAIARGAKGYSRDFEIDNEPHLGFPSFFRVDMLTAADIYSEVTRCMAEAIKREIPDARILAAGCNITHQPHKDFMKRVMQNIGDIVDVLPVHPYTDLRYIGPDHSDIGPDEEKIYENTMELHRVCAELGYHPEIWYGEIGWALDYREDFLSASALRHAAYLSQLMLGAVSADVKKVFYFLGDQHIERHYYYYGVWRAREPLPAAQAYATCAQFLEGASPDAIIRNSETRIHTYRHRDGNLFAAVWLLGDRTAQAILDFGGFGGNIRVRDFMNREMPPPEKGRLSFAASRNPVYIIAGPDSDEDAFRAALKNADFAIPPAKITWRIISGEFIEVTLDNLRDEAFSGVMTFIDGKNTERDVFVAAGESSRFVFDLAPSAELERTVSLAVESPLGRLLSEYQLNLIPCVRNTPPADGSLPQTGRMVPMVDRTHLYPNDPGNGWDGPANLSVESSVSYDDDNLYILIDATDDVHFQVHSSGTLWEDDCVQLAIDTGADAQMGHFGFDDNDFEFGFGLNADGAQAEITWLPDESRRAEILNSMVFDVTRDGIVTRYRIAIPWKCLNVTPKQGTVFGMNYIINDNDGFGSRYNMGLSSGISEGKNPSAYKKFLIQ